jgi:hypothetical protein
MDILRLFPKELYRSVKKLPLHVVSLSETTSSGNLWYFHTFSTYA